MSENLVNFGFGSVQFIKEVEATPPTTKVEGNVTINNAGVAGKPEHFLVTFMLSCADDGPISQRDNIFHWTVAVSDLPRDTPYSEVEEAAARKLAPMLREVAESVEKLVSDFDGKMSEKSKSDPS
ncbi:hypothetical protein QWY75_02525 [Pontixanthobacter aestiaquae]|uniref:Uncharacterized protein n=1 Tax=Pontixanthobacter aestiaquae TaxID=1509367 RepID=A0A844Z5I3_9SPHN|nr:hypothetical protein [Pontixanthobacter aestiaquae]MDN3645079.1 hypothetical protein [Pontixanthobacter aestiaquae]MXO83921.1 hypothetical protein [Pontixanthobacter aestiaquae]